ncbi:MAG: co-chaperone GroES [Fidelibacterota bacterium]
MKSKNKHIIVVGDRILIRPDSGEKKSASGLYLPPSVMAKQDVRGGVVVEVGPGIPLGKPSDAVDEPWETGHRPPDYFPTQAEIGDYALFVSKSAIEINVEDIPYLIVPQSAILVLIRDDLDALAD